MNHAEIIKGSSTIKCILVRYSTLDADKCFIPSKVSINAGDTISWTNDDTAVHTTTGGSISTGTTGTFDSGLIQSGVMYEYTFDSAGTFDYFCVVHPWMSGSISVN